MRRFGTFFFWGLILTGLALAEPHVLPQTPPAKPPIKAPGGEAKGNSLTDLECSTIVDLIRHNGNRIPKSIKGWREIVGAFGGGLDAVFPVSRAPAQVDFDFPRFLIGAGSRLRRSPEPWKMRTNDGDLFLGMVPDDHDRTRHHLEFISWNPVRSTYEFGIIKDFNNPSRREIVTKGSEVAACLECHKNGGPIFTEDPWIGSIGNTLSGGTPKFHRFFMERAFRRSPDHYRQAIKTYGGTESPYIDFGLMQKAGEGHNILLPDGTDTGFPLNVAGTASIDQTIRQANNRRMAYVVLKDKTPAEREDFFRTMLQAFLTGDESEAEGALDKVRAEIKKKDPSAHPSLFGDAIKASQPSLMSDDPIEFQRQRREGKIKLDPEFSMAGQRAVAKSRNEVRLGPQDMLNVSDDDNAVFKALKADVEHSDKPDSAKLVNDFLAVAFRSDEVSHVLRDGIPQRERLFATLTEALKREAKQRGISTPSLEKIKYVPRPCEHRWGDGTGSTATTATVSTSSCARCHAGTGGSRLMFGFDPMKPESWKERFSGTSGKDQKKLKELLKTTIDVLETKAMPPPGKPEADTFTTAQRRALIEALKKME